MWQKCRCGYPRTTCGGGGGARSPLPRRCVTPLMRWGDGGEDAACLSAYRPSGCALPDPSPAAPGLHQQREHGSPVYGSGLPDPYSCPAGKYTTAICYHTGQPAQRRARGPKTAQSIPARRRACRGSCPRLSTRALYTLSLSKTHIIRLRAAHGWPGTGRRRALRKRRLARTGAADASHPAGSGAVARPVRGCNTAAHQPGGPLAHRASGLRRRLRSPSSHA